MNSYGRISRAHIPNQQNKRFCKLVGYKYIHKPFYVTVKTNQKNTIKMTIIKTYILKGLKNRNKIQTYSSERRH